MTCHRRWFVLFLVFAASGGTSLVQAEAPPTDFYSIDPCRAVDTRESTEGPVRPGLMRLFTVDGCGVPLSAFAVAVNVTVVDTVGSVEIRAFPGDLSPGTAMVVAAGPAAPTRSAMAVLRLATDGSGTLGVLGVFASGSGQAHLVLDVTGYFDLEDPGSTEDPGRDDGQSTLGLPPQAYDGDPQLLDFPELYPSEQVGTDPSYGYEATAEPMDCRQYSGGTVAPIGVWGLSPRYLAYAGQVKLLVGASADVACHFRYTKNNLMLDKCNSGPSISDPPGPGQPTPSPGTHYAQVLTGLKNAGLNKMRLWVALGWEKDKENVPFLWVDEDENVGGRDHWRLDQKNQAYFDRIRAVVSKAKELDMFVEVTFFAPFQGGGFSGSPWSWNANRAKALDEGQTGPPTRVGFTGPYYFTIHDPNTGVQGARNERMRQYQRKVIEWTIDELWCYDNVFWEVANEAEDQHVLPLSVAGWQRDMIAMVRQRDCPANAPDCTDHLPALTRRHLIAVQPFTQAGGDSFVADASVAILNGHYAQVRSDSVRTIPNPPGTENRLDLGAIQLARLYGASSKALGFNEGKITPLGGTGGTRSHVNGVLAEGPEGARAEAWEFLFDRGGILDHWGYLSKDGATSPTVQAIRQQLSALKTFMSGAPLSRLRSSTNPPGWIIGNTLNAYPDGTLPWDSGRKSQRYWAALQTDENAATARWFLLYIHHSTRRCTKKGNSEPDFTASGCPGNPPPGKFLAFGGYDARVWTAPLSKRYRESFEVGLGPEPGTFDVFWINPANLQTVKQQGIAWRKTSCNLAGCIICSNPSPSSPCTVGLNSNEGYDFDIVLKIVQRP